MDQKKMFKSGNELLSLQDIEEKDKYSPEVKRFLREIHQKYLNQNIVYYWRKNIGLRSFRFGHLSMSLKDGTHVSHFPSKPKRRIIGKPGRQISSLLEDIILEGGPPDEYTVLPIYYKLDQLKASWQTLVDKEPIFNLLTLNCALCVLHTLAKSEKDANPLHYLDSKPPTFKQRILTFLGLKREITPKRGFEKIIYASALMILGNNIPTITASVCYDFVYNVLKEEIIEEVIMDLYFAEDFVPDMFESAFKSVQMVVMETYGRSRDQIGKYIAVNIRQKLSEKLEKCVVSRISEKVAYLILEKIMKNSGQIVDTNIRLIDEMTLTPNLEIIFNSFVNPECIDFGDIRASEYENGRKSWVERLQNLKDKRDIYFNDLIDVTCEFFFRTLLKSLNECYIESEIPIYYQF